MNGIKVRDLIKLLEQYNPEAEVSIDMYGEHAPYRGSIYIVHDEEIVLEI